MSKNLAASFAVSIVFLASAFLGIQFLIQKRIKTNTFYSDSFAESVFISLDPGVSKKDVIKRLGSPLSVHYKILYANGSENIITSRFNNDGVLQNEVFRYSAPIDNSKDFYVFEVGFDKNGAMIWRKKFHTD